MALSQKPQVLLQTEQIQDAAVRHNFDLINEELRKRIQNHKPVPCNIAFSDILGLPQVFNYDAVNLRHYPPGLSVSLTSRGNPISVKLMGANISHATSYVSICKIAESTNAGNATMTIGLIRGTEQVFAQQLTISLVTGLGGMYFQYSFPVFEFTDPVPAGSYTYKVFIDIGLVNNSVTLAACQLVAKEE